MSLLKLPGVSAALLAVILLIVWQAVFMASLTASGGRFKFVRKSL